MESNNNLAYHDSEAYSILVNYLLSSPVLRTAKRELTGPAIITTIMDYIHALPDGDPEDLDLSEVGLWIRWETRNGKTLPFVYIHCASLGELGTHLRDYFLKDPNLAVSDSPAPYRTTLGGKRYRVFRYSLVTMLKVFYKEILGVSCR